MTKKKLFLSGVLIVVLLQLQCTNGSSATLKKTTHEITNLDENDRKKLEGTEYQFYKIDIEPEYIEGTIYTVGEGEGEYHKYTHQAGVQQKITAQTQKDLWFREYIPTAGPADFKVMQFNMLADGLSGVWDPPTTGKAFDHADPDQMVWSIRGKQIIEEMLRSGADVIVVEENDKFDEIYRGLNDEEREWDGIMMNKRKSPTQNLNKDSVMQDLLNAGKRGPLPADGVSIYWNKKTFEYNGEGLNEYLGLNKSRIDAKVPFDSELLPEQFNQIDALYNGKTKLVKIEKGSVGGDKGPFLNWTRVLKANYKDDVVIGEFPTDREEGLAEDLQVKKEGKKYLVKKDNKETEIKEPKEVYLAIKLRHKNKGQDIVFVATHLKSEKEQIGEDTRIWQAKYLMKKVEENFTEDFPIIFCADMNAGQVPLKVGEKKVYLPETYNYLTKTMKDSQKEMVKTSFDSQGNPIHDPFQHWTTAKVRSGVAAIMVEDYILYQNFENEGKITPVGYYSYPNLDDMSPFLLPATYYPSDHIAIATGFKIETKGQIARRKKAQQMSKIVISMLITIVFAYFAKGGFN